MTVSSTISTVRKRKAHGIPESVDAPPGNLPAAGGSNEDTCGTTGTFVYLKARRGMKSRSAQTAVEEWRPKMWTYLR